VRRALVKPQESPCPSGGSTSKAVIQPMAQSLFHTPLFDLVVESKARMTAFAGWEMPVQFQGITQEHRAVRQQAGMFDISHMGRLLLKGPNLTAQLQTLVPSDLSTLQPGLAQYTVILNEAGGIIDDVICYYQGETADNQNWTLIVNGANREKDKTWLQSNLDKAVQLEDVTPTTVLLAIQGPEAVARLQPLVDTDLQGIPRFGHRQDMVLGQPGFLARTGYTGEDGFEVMVPPGIGQQLWRSLLGAGVVPCGLGARDTLRLEAAMVLHGQDIDETTTPLDASLSWLVHLERKGNFVGRVALEHQQKMGLTQKLVGLEMAGRHIARHGYPVLVDGATVGQITSGTWSPTLEKAIALAYVPPDLAQVGQTLAVEIRGHSYPGRVVRRPFYRRSAP